jgi:hypothetical protein
MQYSIKRRQDVAQLFGGYSRKVPVSIPDGVIGIFIDIIPPAALWL